MTPSAIASPFVLRGQTKPVAYLVFGLCLLLLAVVAGFAAILLPGVLVVALAGIIALTVGGIIWPEFLIAAMLLLACGFFPETVLPKFGLVRIEDVLLCLVCMALVIRHFLKVSPWLDVDRSALVAVGLLECAMAASVIIGVGYWGVPIKAALAEFRVYLYVLPLVILPLLLRSPGDIERLWRLLVVVMMVLAVGQIVQGVFGIAVLHGGRLETAVTLDHSYEGATRSTLPGIYLIIFGLLYSLLRAFGTRRIAWLWIPWIAVFALALLLTYGRALWIVSVAGIAVVALSLQLRQKVTVAVLGVISIVGGLALFAMAKPVAFAAVTERAMSVGQELHGGSSLDWRKIENDYAWRKIGKSPVLGNGLGVSYKPLAGGLDAWVEQTRFIHNGYMYLFLKVGLVGAIVFGFFWSHLVRCAQRGVRMAMLRDAHIGRAFLVLTLLPPVTAVVRPEWADQGTLVVFSILGGVVTALVQQQKLKATEPPASIHRASV
jgi:O-antigen ligase